MSFLAPVAFWFAAVAIPALLILYFLKLRRREQRVSSTLLWRRAVQDLQVNAPFQRLRKNLLLFLQLAVLLLAILALARPIVFSELRNDECVAILVDHSASMNAIEDGQTRLELAKEQARRLVRTLNRSGAAWWQWFGGAASPTRVMLIAFADRATIISPFTSNLAELSARVDDIRASDAPTNIREALDLAEAHLTQTRVDARPADAITDLSGSRIVLLSDGAIPDLDQATVRTGQVTLIPIGKTEQNAGVTSLRCLRDYESPDHLAVFVQVANFAAEPVETELSFYLDGVLRRVEKVSLGRVRRASEVGGEDSGEAAPAVQSLEFRAELPTAGLLEVRLALDDALTCDNRASAVIPAPRRLRVLLVSERNPFLERMLQQLPLVRFDYRTPEQFAAMPAGQFEQNGRCTYDVVVFDKFAPASLPRGSYVFFGAVPPVEGVALSEDADPHTLVWWDSAHPLLRYVELEYVEVYRGGTLTLPKDAEVLAEGPHGPVLGQLSRDGRQMLMCAFAVESSSWWAKLGFAVFMYNTFNYLGGGGTGEQRTALQPGDSIRLELPSGVEQAVVTRPDGGRQTMRLDSPDALRYAATETVGLYRVEPAAPGSERFAVNLENAAESDIAPRDALAVGGRPVELGRAIETATPEVWRWFAAAALAIVLLEWYIYNRRVMI